MDGFRLLELIGLELDLPVISKWRSKYIITYTVFGYGISSCAYLDRSDVLERRDEHSAARCHARGGRLSD